MGGAAGLGAAGLFGPAASRPPEVEGRARPAGPRHLPPEPQSKSGVALALCRVGETRWVWWRKKRVAGPCSPPALDTSSQGCTSAPPGAHTRPGRRVALLLREPLPGPPALAPPLAPPPGPGPATPGRSRAGSSCGRRGRGGRRPAGGVRLGSAWRPGLRTTSERRQVSVPARQEDPGPEPSPELRPRCVRPLPKTPGARVPEPHRPRDPQHGQLPGGEGTESWGTPAKPRLP
uniref:basic proline-rich protein-like n=1 Tax=Halichoerus grypus TaxID=9711 RepID=UPI001659D743|nr:basic proline-rich protein-like [Halichoerus grypus]